MKDFSGRTVFITGASRGIGRAIALRLGHGGANVVVAAKSSEPHPKLPGTIHETARDVEKAGERRSPSHSTCAMTPPWKRRSARQWNSLAG